MLCGRLIFPRQETGINSLAVQYGQRKEGFMILLPYLFLRAEKTDNLQLSIELNGKTSLQSKIQLTVLNNQGIVVCFMTLCVLSYANAGYGFPKNVLYFITARRQRTTPFLNKPNTSSSTYYMAKIGKCTSTNRTRLDRQWHRRKWCQK